MTIHVLRTVPLALSTRMAWAGAGAHIVPRKTIQTYFGADLNLPEEDVVINLGWRRHINHANVWNRSDSVMAVSRPDALRETLGYLLPPYPEDGDLCWGKNHGMKGDGKHKFAYYYADLEGQYSDFQKHVPGTEYRVNTVGSRVVQAHRKDFMGADKTPNWVWVGVQGIADTGIVSRTRAAVDIIPNGGRTVFGWDWIVDDEGTPWLLEVNTSAGVNESTARRILDLIRQHHSTKPATVS